jgi:hypothetical protein
VSTITGQHRKIRANTHASSGVWVHEHNVCVAQNKLLKNLHSNKVTHRADNLKVRWFSHTQYVSMADKERNVLSRMEWGKQAEVENICTIMYMKWSEVKWSKGNVPVLYEEPRHEYVLGSGGTTPSGFNLGARWRRVVSFTPRPLHLRGKNPPGAYRMGGWVGPRGGLDAGAKRKNLCPCRKSNRSRPASSSVTILTELPRLGRRWSRPYSVWHISSLWGPFFGKTWFQIHF